MAKQSHKEVSFLSLLVVILLAVVVFVSYGLWGLMGKVTTLQSSIAQSQTDSPQITSVSYSCDGNKTIQAQFYNNTAEINLSDGRSLLLTQGIAASGVRYTNSDETVTFWTKGNTSFFQQGQQVTYNNCVEKTQ